VTSNVLAGIWLLDVAGAAAYLGVTESFIRSLVFQKRIRSYEVAKFVRFRIADLDAFVVAGRGSWHQSSRGSALGPRRDRKRIAVMGSST
jgi:excisionase family DNA binding protein